MKFGEGGGQFETTIEIQLPKEVSPGTYRVVWLLDGYSVSANNEATFVVGG
jgi:predicted alpha/beta superfamily hydrolase